MRWMIEWYFCTIKIYNEWTVNAIEMNALTDKFMMTINYIIYNGCTAVPGTQYKVPYDHL